MILKANLAQLNRTGYQSQEKGLNAEEYKIQSTSATSK